MTLEEAIELANQGDLEVMNTLARYYYDQKEYNEARTWHCRAAEGGLVQAFIPAALLTNMLTRAARKVSGGGAIHDQDVFDLTRALQWIDRARANGLTTDADGSIIRERALCAYAASKKEGSSITAEDAIAYLKEGYATTGRTPEVEIYLAFALFEAPQLSPEDASFCFNLLKRCCSYTEEDEPDVKLGILDAYLGLCYLDGKGCSVDDNAAYECFLKAGQKDFDCSDMLRNFKKKMFGGYVFKR